VRTSCVHTLFSLDFKFVIILTQSPLDVSRDLKYAFPHFTQYTAYLSYLATDLESNIKYLVEAEV
jgi:hypothetical protein